MGGGSVSTVLPVSCPKREVMNILTCTLIVTEGIF